MKQQDLEIIQALNNELVIEKERVSKLKTMIREFLKIMLQDGQGTKKEFKILMEAVDKI